MYNKLRKLIKESLHKVLEADATTHFNDRVKERIDPLNNLNIPEKGKINQAIAALKNVDFLSISRKTHANKFAIFLGQLNIPQIDSPYTFYDDRDHRYYYKFLDKSGKLNWGDQVWAVAGTRDGSNNLISIFLKRSTDTRDINRLKYYMNVDMVIKNVYKFLPQSVSVT